MSFVSSDSGKVPDDLKARTTLGCCTRSIPEQTSNYPSKRPIVPLLILRLYQVRRAHGRRAGPHSPGDLDSVLLLRVEAGLLAILPLQLPERVDAAEGDQNQLPQQQEDLLHGEVRRRAAAEARHHAEKFDDQ